MYVLLAALPILLVGVLMLGFMWPSSKAMPFGWLVALLVAFFAWQMPVRWITAATIAGIINTIDILLIVFGAILILQLMRRSGGIDGISRSMRAVSTDRRVQIILIAWLMGCFFEGAAGFGSPAAVAAPLLVGMGFPPLVAASATLMADSTPVTFGAVGVPVWGGFAALKTIIDFPYSTGQSSLQFPAFLHAIGAFSGIMHFLAGTFIPLAIVVIMTKIVDGSFKKGFAIWPLAVIGGVVFTLPQMLLAIFLGPELPALLGSLIGLPLFLFILSRGWGVPKENWDFPPHSKWPSSWEGKIKAGESEAAGTPPKMNAFKSWLPYGIIGIILLISRVQAFAVTPLLRAWTIQWENILDTSISRGVTPLYNPGVIPFLLVAILIPLLHNLSLKEAFKAVNETFRIITPAAVALVFTLGMVYIMMNSGEAQERNSMVIVLAEAAADIAGGVWYAMAPFVGILGTFISGSNTVSNIMFGPFQYGVAKEVGLSAIPILSLQAVGGAAGNMICIHNVVAALTTVGLVGKEGLVIRKNITICLLYGALAGLFGWLFSGAVVQFLF